MNELNLTECKRAIEQIESYRFRPILLDKDGYKQINEISTERVEKIKSYIRDYPNTVNDWKKEAFEISKKLEAQYTKTSKKNKDWFFTSTKGKIKHACAIEVASKQYQTQLSAKS